MSSNQLGIGFGGNTGGIMLYGVVQQLNEDDLRHFEDGTYGDSKMQEYILTGGGVLNSPEAVFMPQAIMYPSSDKSKFKVVMGNHLQLLSRLDDSSKPDNICEYNDFRRQVIKALGTEHELSELQANDQVKKVTCDIEDAASWIDAVDVNHSGGVYSTELSDGISAIKNGTTEWLLPMFITVNNLLLFGLSISGHPMHQLLSESLTICLDEADHTKARVKIHFNPSTDIYGDVSVEEFDLQDDDWKQNVCNALFSGGVDLNLAIMTIKLVDIEDSLIALGVDYKNRDWQLLSSDTMPEV